MFQTAVICAVALFASALTLFSGFGLGTLLMPAFTLFFPVGLAVAMTAVVHLLNNLFKLVLVGRRAERKIVLRFGLPALLGALAGASALGVLSGLPEITRYHLLGAERTVMPVKLVVAAVMALFVLVEAHPRFSKLEFPSSWLPAGGLLSGFFGGLSGHQGALRSAFLAKSGLDTGRFIGTGAVIAVLVDAARLSVYAKYLAAPELRQNGPLLSAATAAAFLGAWGGARFMKKVTMRGVQRLVAALLLLIAAGLASGLL